MKWVARTIACQLSLWALRLTPKDDVYTLVAFHSLFRAMLKDTGELHRAPKEYRWSD